MKSGLLKGDVTMENRFTMLNTPDNVCFTASNRQNRKGPTRVTENYEIELYLTDGATTFLCGKEIPIRRHLFFFARPGMERYTVGNFSTMNIHFLCHDPDFAARYLDTLPERTMPLSPGRTEERFRTFVKALKMPSPCRELRTEGLLLQILSDYFESLKKETKAAPRRIRYAQEISALTDYLREHFKEKIRVPELAARIPVSPNFFQVIFREQVGMPPAEYLRMLRVQEAARLLAGSDLPLCEVAEQSGLCSGSYLTYLFEKEYGLSPSLYRAQNRIGI